MVLLHDAQLYPRYFCDVQEIDENGIPIKRHKRKVLSDGAREAFMRIEILCTEYRGLTETQEIELFQRVQLGKPLTSAEAFRATQGSWQQFAKLYEKDFADVVNLVKQKRASGFRGILACFSQIYECLDPIQANGVPRLRNSMKSIESLCSNPQSLDAMTKSHLRFVFETFRGLVELDRSIFEDNGYRTVRTFAPVELIAVCCLISQKMERPLGMLRGDILAMRKQMREIHPELRVNRECWASIWKFIEGLEKQRGAVDGPTFEHTRWRKAGRPRGSTQRRMGNSNGRSLPARNSQNNNVALSNNSSLSNSRPLPNLRNTFGVANMTNQTSPIAPVGYESTTNPARPAASISNQSQNRSNGDLPRLQTGPEQQDTRFNEARSQLLEAANITADESERTIRYPSTAAVPRRTSEPSSAASIVTDNVTPGSAIPVPASRKRLALDLGESDNDVLALEVKRARLRAGIIKQEQE